MAFFFNYEHVRVLNCKILSLSMSRTILFLEVNRKLYHLMIVRSQHSPYKYSNCPTCRSCKYLRFLISVFTVGMLRHVGMRFEVANRTSTHAQVRQCFRHVAKRVQHHATSKMLQKNPTIFKLEPTTRNMLQQGWPNVCNMLCPTMLQYVTYKCCEHLSGA